MPSGEQICSPDNHPLGPPSAPRGSYAALLPLYTLHKAFIGKLLTYQHGTTHCRAHSGCTPPRSYRLHTPKVMTVAPSTLRHTPVAHPPDAMTVAPSTLMHTPVAHPPLPYLRSHAHSGCTRLPTAIPVAYSTLMHTPVAHPPLPYLRSHAHSAPPLPYRLHTQLSCTLRFAHTQVCTHSGLHTSCHPM